MPTIHDTAMIDPQAELADDVVIGPYCVIGPHVTIGAGTQLMSHVVLMGHTTIGRGNRLWPHAVLGGEPQDLKYRGEPSTLVIGDHNDIREYVTMHVGTDNGDGTTTVGDRNLFMVGAHVAHDSHIGDHCMLANNVLLAGHITINDYATVSGGAAIHHFVTIGRYAYVGGNSGIVHDVPPYMIADGHPARVRSVNVIGMHRHDFPDQAIDRLKHVCRMLYKRENGNQAEAIDLARREFAEEPACVEVCDFARRAAASPNGRYRESLRPDDKRCSPVR